MNWIEHKYVGNHFDAVACYPWFRNWGIGFAIEPRGVRFLLGKWQYYRQIRKAR